MAIISQEEETSVNNYDPVIVTKTFPLEYPCNVYSNKPYAHTCLWFIESCCKLFSKKVTSFLLSGAGDAPSIVWDFT